MKCYDPQRKGRKVRAAGLYVFVFYVSSSRRLVMLIVRYAYKGKLVFITGTIYALAILCAK